MEKLKVLVTAKFSKSQIKYIEEGLGEGFELVIPEDLEGDLSEYKKDTPILLGDYITDNIIKDSGVRTVQIPWAGVDKLNIDLVKSYGLDVYNSHSNALSVAEYAVAMLLGIGKKIPFHDKIFREGDWNRRGKEDLGHENLFSDYLYGKKVGFIGYGNIGRATGKLLAGFNPEIYVVVSDKNREYEEVSFVGDYNDLDYVLGQCDYIVVATALTEKTKGLINLENIKKMKKTSYLVNISRGEIIEEEALYEALKNRWIRGAGIDTWYKYPEGLEGKTMPSKFKFEELSNIIMTPHRAAQMYSEFPYLDDAIENIKAFKESKPLKNKVDLEKGY